MFCIMAVQIPMKLYYHQETKTVFYRSPEGSVTIRGKINKKNEASADLFEMEAPLGILKLKSAEYFIFVTKSKKECELPLSVCKKMEEENRVDRYGYRILDIEVLLIYGDEDPDINGIKNLIVENNFYYTYENIKKSFIWNTRMQEEYKKNIFVERVNRIMNSNMNKEEFSVVDNKKEEEKKDRGCLERDLKGIDKYSKEKSNNENKPFGTIDTKILKDFMSKLQKKKRKPAARKRKGAEGGFKIKLDKIIEDVKECQIPNYQIYETGVNILANMFSGYIEESGAEKLEFGNSRYQKLLRELNGPSEKNEKLNKDDNLEGKGDFSFEKKEKSNILVCSLISKKKIGPRMLSRGINEDGNTSFFVETVVKFRNIEMKILRGSPPFFWVQKDPIQPKKLRILDGGSEPFKKHFEKILKALPGFSKCTDREELQEKSSDITSNSGEHSYFLSSCSIDENGTDDNNYKNSENISNDEKDNCTVICINLLGNNYYEKLLTDKYNKLCKTANITILNYNLNHYIKKYPYKKIKHRFYRQIEKLILDMYKNRNASYFYSEFSDEKAYKTKQNVAFRVNCMDCLDRTNLGEFFIIGYFFNIKNKILKHLWKNNGNSLSNFYTGSSALKADFTAKEKISVLSRVNDMFISANRMYNNTFTDKEKQRLINLLIEDRPEEIPEYINIESCNKKEEHL